MTHKFKRKYLVDGPYQFSQAGAVILANILVVLLITFLLSWYFLIASDSSMVVNYNRQIPVYLSGCILVVSLLSVFFSMRRSRSTAGMMTILHRILTEAGQGRFPDRDLAFRQSDYSGFRNLADPLNSCLAKMKTGQEPDIKAAVKKLEALVRETGPEEMLPAGVCKELENIIRTLETGRKRN